MKTVFSKSVLLLALILIGWSAFGSVVHAQTRVKSEITIPSGAPTRASFKDSSGRLCNEWDEKTLGVLIDTIRQCQNLTPAGAAPTWFRSKTTPHYETGAPADVITDPAVDAQGYLVENSTEVNNAVPGLDGAGTTVTNAQTGEKSTSGKSVGGGAFSCNALNPLSWGDCVLKSVAVVILTFANLLLGLAGALLNWVVVKTVFNFGTLIGNSPGLLLAWGIMRDIGNMMLLFGFIFMGLATILDLQTFSAKKALPPLIIFAILMNFSLFAAEAVIDTSNALTSVMYSQANTDDCGKKDGGIFGITSGNNIKAGNSCWYNYGLAGSIMKSTGLASLFQTDGGPYDIGIVTYIGLGLFATIGAIVMFATSIMLVIRLIVLTFVIVAAPIGFAGMAIPPLRKFADDWWHRLLSQAFFAPVLFLMIFISLKVTDTFAQGDTRSSLAAALTSNSTSTMGIIMIFTIVIGFLVGSLLAAKSMGATGAGMAIGFSKKMVLGAYGGVAGFAGRNTFGRGAGALQKRYEGWAGGTGGGRGERAARAIVGRNILGIDTGINAALERTKKGKFGGSQSFEEERKSRADRQSHLAHEANKAQDIAALAAAMAAGNDTEVGRILQRMSLTDIEQTRYAREGAAGINMLARNLSPEKFEQYMNNKENSAEAKHRMSHERYSTLGAAAEAARVGFAAGATPAELAAARTAQTEIRRWSPKDLELAAKFDPGLYDSLINVQNTDGDSIISDDQFDVLQKSNTLTNIQKQQTKDQSRNSRVNRLLDTAGGRRPTIAEVDEAERIIGRISGDKNIAKLSADVLTNDRIANSFSIPQLGAIMTEDKLSIPQRRILAGIIQRRAAGDPRLAAYINPALNPAAAAYYTP